MKRKLVYSLTIIIIAIPLTLWILFLITKMPNEQNNGFSREWLKDSLKYVQNIPISLPITNICGITNQNIFVKGKNPQWILMVNKNLTKVDTFFFDIKESTKLQVAYTVKIDSPWIYLYANNLKSIVHGQLNSTNLAITELNTNIFTRAVQISPQTTIIRALDSTQKKQIFQQVNSSSGKVIRQADIIENQTDAGFSTDGILRYDSTTKRLIYVQNYQNRFFCLDTNLNLLYTAHTIDTNSINSLKVEQVMHDQERGSFMPSASRVTVNRDCIVNNGYIFVSSGFIANNENAVDFNQKMVVDIYRVDNGKYLGSFYVPSIQGKRPKSMAINDNLLIALYPNHIATYQISL